MRVLIITNLKILLTIFFFINNFLFGLPKFTIKDGVSCIACHINPTGSGLRNDYGTNIVSIDALPLERWLENADENWDGYISENLQIGGDFRIQAIKYNNTDSTQKTAVFPMQADIYSYFSYIFLACVARAQFLT